MPRDELLGHVWQRAVVGDAALSTIIKGERYAVGDSGDEKRVIRTLRGHGYRFVARIDAHTKDANRPAARSSGRFARVDSKATRLQGKDHPCRAAGVEGVYSSSRSAMTG